MKKIPTIMLAVLILISTAASAFAKDIPSAQGEIFSMDTYMTITCYGDDADAALQDALAEITRLNDLLSVGNEDSEISLINKNGAAILSEDSAAMVETALNVYHGTGGAFDITIYPMMELWGFTTQNFRVPSDEEIASTLALVNSDALEWDRDTRALTLGAGQSIDLGGIAKGYTSDRLMNIFGRHGLVSAVISLGGNVHCYGSKTDGSPWKVGIQDPYDPSGIVGIVRIRDCAVITSGGYERYFTDEATGKTYHHIIDPATGRSAESGLLSVSIVTPNGVLADALSTACFIMGLEKASDYWRESSETFDIIFMTEDNEIYVTEGLEETFTTDLPLHVIHK